MAALSIATTGAATCGGALADADEAAWARGWLKRRLVWERALRDMERARAEAVTPVPVPTDAAVVARGVRKSYGDRPVLTDVDLEVGAGEVFALLGPNGAGKTTTLEILEGFRRADAGHVRVLGLDPSSQPAALRERVGVVLQECGFPPHLRVRELLDAWRGYYPKPRALGDLLDVVELGSQAETLIRRLSGGQRRRLDFALALAGDPDLVFLDEPTTGFDPEARLRCWAAIDNLRTLGKTIVLTTHYLDEAERLGDRVAILAAGTVRLAGSPQQLGRMSSLPTRISFNAPQPGAPLPAGLEGQVEGGRFVVRASDPAPVLHVILDWAPEGRPDPLGLAVTPPTLEDVYLHVAGDAAVTSA